MMDCSAYKELSGLRPEDLSDHEREGLREHGERCESCLREQGDDEELLAAVDRLPSLESDITAADIWRLDGLEPAVTGAAAEPAVQATRSHFPVVLAVAAAAALAVVLGPRLVQKPAEPEVESGVRLKAVTPPFQPASLELQFSLETRGLGSGAVIAASDGALVAADERLLFGVRAEGNGDVSLIERGPDGALQVVDRGGDVGWRVDDAGLAILVDETGRPLGYRPDGDGGEYNYVGLLTAPAGRALTPSEAEALLEGTAVPGISLLARDDFAIEWRQDDALDSTR
jgi:hypothetical protein